MKNRIASLFLVFALLMSLCGNAVARDNRIVVQSGGAERFTDVPTSHWAYSYINKVVGSGLFNGMTPTTFAPSDAMTRAQFVIVMSRMEGLNVERVETPTKFPDVASTYWAAGAIAWATEAGIVGGFGDGTFKPTSPITRGQFAALIHRYIVSKRYVNLHVVDPEPAQFTDAASVSSAFTNDVEYARVHGLLTGYSDGTVRASNPITRAAIAAILARFLDLVQESGYTPLLDGPVIDGGDSGTTPVETPTAYDAIKLSVLAGTHGQTAIASVLRNGQQVASDDVQAGDRVTITHRPESGYVASVRVRDANGKVVTVHKTDANTSWFDMPAAMPVTVTVTYSKESSGGGGGGGGSGGNYNNNDSTSLYYFLNLSADETTNGTIEFVKGDVSGRETLDGVTRESNIKDNWFQPNNSNFTFSVILTPADTYSVSGDPVVTDGSNTYNATKTAVIDGANVYVYSVTNATSSTSSSTNALNVTVSATFTKGGTTPADKWQLTARVTGGFVAISDSPTFDKAAITETTVSKEVSKDTTTLYVAFTRDDAKGYTGDPIVTPDLGSTHSNSVSGELWIYEVDSSDDVTSVFASFMNDDPMADGVTNPVTVIAKLGESTSDELPVPTAEANNTVGTSIQAKIGDTVTITAPETAGYGSGYYVEKVTATAENAPVSLPQPDNTTADANGETSTFTMVGSPVTVTVTYAVNKDEDLSYGVNVTMNNPETGGTGSLTLNVAGMDYPLSNAEGGVTTVDLSDNDGVPASKGEYISLYGAPKDNQWSLPIYATAPVPSSDSKLTTFNSSNPNLSRSSKEEPAQLLPNTDATVNVQFDKIQSYGYKLTVIGQGSVTGTFDNDDINIPENTTGQPVTKTSGSIVKENAPSLDITATAATGWALDGIEVITPTDKKNGTSDTQTSNTYSANSMEPGITEIIVSFYDKSAGAVLFKVTGTNAALSNVTLKAENGRIKAGSSIPDDYNEQLNSAPKTVNNLTSSANTFYARVGTIITLQAKSGILKLVDVWKDGSDVDDIDDLATAGFSYTLPAATLVEIKVDTGEKDSYSVAFQLPYSDGADKLTSADIHTKTIGINEEDLKTILYSLNDGYKESNRNNPIDGKPFSNYWGAWDSDVSGIQNNYGLFGNRLTEVLSYYLTDSHNSDGQTGAQALEETLNDIVEDEVKNNLNNIIKSQKDDMLSAQRDSLTQSIQDELNKQLVPSSDKPSVEITDPATKASIIKAVIASGKADDTVLDNYKVTATVEPLLNDSQLASSGLSDEKKAQVSTVQSQLSAYILEYLDQKMHISEVDTEKATATASVKVIDADNCTVRVSVEAALADRPVVDSSFANLYANELMKNISLLSTLTVEHNRTPITGLANSITKDVVPMSSVKFDDEADSAKMTNDITGKLGAVDDAINDKWNTQLADYISESKNSSGKYDVYVDMKTVLDKSMIDKVVEGTPDDPNDEEGALEKIANSISKKVESAKPATNTKNALMNVYRRFVSFNKGQDDLLTLNTRNGNSTVLGRVVDNDGGKGNSLVLYLDFDRILADKNHNDDTAYERFIDLVVALRDGFATDIRVNPNVKGQTAESVISSLIRGQLDRSGVRLSANKWGSNIGYGGRALTDLEKQEVCDLAATLVMTPLNDGIDDAWADFEQSGYQSVSLVVNIDTANRGGALKQLAESLSARGLSGTTANTISAGFKVVEELK